MSIKEIRQQLHDYIDGVDDKGLKGIFAMLEGDVTEFRKLNDTQKTVPTKKPDAQNKPDRPLTWDENMAMAKLALQKRRGEQH